MPDARAITGSALRWPGFLLGFSLGGFFDGILLHQILQWHHLLSSVDLVRDVRGQVLADGLFHALMYLIGAFGLFLLWKRRPAVAEAGAGNGLWGWALVGFGGWHVIDAVLSHWIIGLHRIRMDTQDPLMWDLAWVVVFGAVPLVLGWLLIRRARSGGPGHGGQGGQSRAAAALLALAVLFGGPIAAVPPGGSDQVMIVFAPGVSPGAALGALADVDARVLWVDRSGGLWAVAMKDRGAAWRLYRRGALLVSSSAVAFGCFSWSRAT